MYADGNYVYEFADVNESMPEAIVFFATKHIKHIIDCYKTGAEIVVPYEATEEGLEFLDFSQLEKIGQAPYEAITAVKHAATSESLKPVYNSVCLFAGADFKSTGVAATDTARLSFYQCDLQGLTENVILPLQFVNLINSDVEVFSGNGKVYFKSGNLYCDAAVDGTFPNVVQVIPDYQTLKYGIRILEMDKLKNYFELFNVGISSIIFNADGETVTINNTNTVSLKYKMSENAPAVKVRFSAVMDALKISDSFKYNGGMNPLVFKSQYQTEVVMPIQVK